METRDSPAAAADAATERASLEALTASLVDTAATASPSLAATFPIFGSRRSRDAPLPIRQTRGLRFLARRGAMEPEGVSALNFKRLYDNQRLSPVDVRAMLKALWQFRLKGWTISDVDYLDWPDVQGLVEDHTRRPADTLDLIPDWFADRHSASELIEYRFGTVGVQ